MFAGGWTLEAAEAVGAGGRRSAEATCSTSSPHLVEKSLVTLDRERRALPACSKPCANTRTSGWSNRPNGDAARVAAPRVLSRPRGKRPPRARSDRNRRPGSRRLDLERENLLSAHACCDRADGAPSPGCGSSCDQALLAQRGLLGVGYQVTVEALARAGAQARSLARCGALADAGQIGMLSSAGTRRRKGCSRKASRLRGSSATRSGSRPCSSRSAWPASATATSRRRAGTSPRRWRWRASSATSASSRAALNALAQLHRMEGELDEAEPLYERRRGPRARAGRSRDSSPSALLNLAMVSIGRGGATPARAMLLEVLAIAEEIGSKPAGQSVLEVSAGLAASREEWANARTLLRCRGSAGAARRGCGAIPPTRRFSQPLVARARDALGATGLRGSRGVGPPQLRRTRSRKCAPGSSNCAEPPAPGVVATRRRAVSGNRLVVHHRRIRFQDVGAVPGHADRVRILGPVGLLVRADVRPLVVVVEVAPRMRHLRVVEPIPGF